MTRANASAILLAIFVALVSTVWTTNFELTKYAFEDVSNGFSCASTEHLFLRNDVPDIYECSKVCFLYKNCITAEFNLENSQCIGCEEFSFQAIPWSTDLVLASRRDYRIDCKDVLAMDEQAKSGVYEIWLYNLEPTDVYCDMETEGGGWTVFQRRSGSSVDFNKTFADYENGFGKVDDEYWLGLRYIQELTVAPSEMRTIVLLRPGSDDVTHSYQTFNLTGRDYQIIAERSADTPEALEIPSAPFYTYDKDNQEGCAAYTGGGWWFGTCNEALNLHFNSIGLSFSSSSGLKEMSMMVRRK